MLLIPCPWCGPRPETEFSYAGDGNVRRPADPDRVSDADWVDYIYVRDNPRGPHVELWQHAASCRRFIWVRRDTLTHAILGAAARREDLP